MISFIINEVKLAFRPMHKRVFFSKTKKNTSLLDVGCGNGIHSVEIAKKFNKQLRYVGVDIADYNQSERSKQLMDNYIFLDPLEFDIGLSKLEEKFDYILCSHNLEHTYKPYDVFIALVDLLKPGGMIYISTPSAKTVNFPSRKGVLNFFDDKTHQKPIDVDRIIKECEKNNLEIHWIRSFYSPLFAKSIGFLLEIPSALLKKCLPGTWEFWGFETIIWIKRP